MTGQAAGERAGVSSQEPHTVRLMIAVSFVCVVAQAALTDYGDSPGAALVWLVLDALLLGFVYVRRSRAARAVMVVLALLGAVVYAVAAVNGDGHAAVLALLFLGQALPLLTPSVRDHVQVAT